MCDNSTFTVDSNEMISSLEVRLGQPADVVTVSPGPSSESGLPVRRPRGLEAWNYHYYCDPGSGGRRSRVLTPTGAV